MPTRCRLGQSSLFETPERLRVPVQTSPEHIRKVHESLVRAEFSYVGENLLLRGGYRKTHFQADQTTLQSVSEMGTRFDGIVNPLSMPDHDTFTLRFTRTPKFLKKPETCRFKEPILQLAIRRHLAEAGNLRMFLALLGVQIDHPEGLEVLGEMAISLGHIDLLLKERVPIGSTFKIPIEVKTKRATPRDVSQLRAYMDELRDDCQIGALIAADFAKTCVRMAADAGISLIRYTLASDLSQTPAFQEIFRDLTLNSAEK